MLNQQVQKMHQYEKAAVNKSKGKVIAQKNSGKV